ncbi:DUF445 domain-containing protein [Terracoccus luteus]|uniref:Uncharacterized membrane-anchored protein YjiN (DUF445 family) n=1 Tax=Terracoccus luteus TaxID=53356 RepID=A0A495XVQ2_9MICO|nr:DUF445 domain-containing protein [Terracoccus luteus]MBB2987160.1 uncharacterized membrane-anchored protein YjiN (DUF445 family) [Terracoccus luteus]MCP2172811.1 uncharacterized membrane-anchored protein YjiN (DUF445 family) [Terracoccus luteus]RKT77205.1 uncharacterized membrane-anchored protein YjiN (DUF445 family) [Terracoccus luteus]
MSGPLAFAVDPAVDARRRRDLRQMRLVATGLLVLAAVVYVLTRGHDDGVLGFVNAGAEASMVGACADWFAVTALFRHPLGLPIPHTALIPRKKEMLGRSLEEFVGENFMREDIIRERVADAEPTRRAAEWALGPGHAKRLVDEVATVGAHALARIPDDDVRAVIEQAVLPRLMSEPVSSLAGGLLDQVVKDDAHVGLVDLALDEMRTWLVDHEDVFESLIIRRAPTWVPAALNDIVARRIHVEALKWVADIRRDPDHEVRQALDGLLVDLAHNLQHDPATQEKAERLKERLLSHPQVSATAMSLWVSARGVAISALEDVDGPLRSRALAEVVALAERLLADDALRGRIDARITDMAVFAVERYGTELTQVISQTVDRWDGKETAERVELQVGRDLQFIRINGTLVGGLIGVLIHAVSVLLPS